MTDTTALPRPIDPDEIRVGDTVQMHDMFDVFRMSTDPLTVTGSDVTFVYFDDGDASLCKVAPGRTWTLLPSRTMTDGTPGSIGDE